VSLQNIEILSVVMNLIFLYLYIQENKFGWLCGIVGSLLGAYIVYCVNLYSEMGLYLFYAVMGAFAFVVWQVKDGENFVIRRMKPQMIILTIITGIVLSLGLGYRMSSTDAEKPFWASDDHTYHHYGNCIELRAWISHVKHRCRKTLLGCYQHGVWRNCYVFGNL